MELLVLTDIHLDLEGSCQQQGRRIGSLYCDVSERLYELLLTTLQNMSYTHCIFLGDAPAHGENADFALVSKVFKDVNCEGYALGNNDAAENYKFTRERILEFENLDSRFDDEGLFYESEFAPGLEYIGLNSVLFNEEGERQLDILEEHLRRCKEKSREMIIGSHIPSGSNSLLSEYWNRNTSERYDSILRHYQDVILVELTGHYHHESWRYFGEVPGFINPGLSPSNGGFPGFRVYSIANGAYGYSILDYEQFYVDLEARSPIFERQYSLTELRPYMHSDGPKITGEVLKQLAVEACFDDEFNRWRTANRAMLAETDINELIEAMI